MDKPYITFGNMFNLILCHSHLC